MTLCFHRDLYAESAVRAAVAAFDKLATLRLEEDGADWVVHIADPHPHFADRLADELGNYCLQLTVTG